MPQARKFIFRHENMVMQTPIESTEEKRNRGIVSCAECRRLKLKCDKAVPCSSCHRRGCAAICPNGKLVTGQGTRLVLADTEKLHEKILLMSDRIRQLEDALSVQSAVAPQETHPLLQSDLLEVKSIIDLHVAVDEDKVRKSAENANTNAEEESQYIEAFGTLALRDDDDDAATFYGRSTGSESLPIGEVAKPLPPRNPIQSDLPHSVKFLSRTFPLAPIFSDTVDLDYLVQNHLPPWHRAWQLSQFYLSQAQWFSGSVTKRQVLEECLPLWYSEASDLIPPDSVAPSTLVNPSDTSAQPQGKSSHELALLFAIFCFGTLIDTALPHSPENEEANLYCSLARASLNLEPVLDRTPSVSTIQTLSLLFICQRMNGDSVESTWGIYGLAMKLAQSIGLHRDCARWQLSSSEVQKRRFLFWELFVTDGWLNLTTGRLTTFYLPFVDCELPNDPDPTVDDDGTILPSFPAWKARFGYQCMSVVVRIFQIAQVPKYSTIVELDRKVRDMELPRYAQRPPPAGAGLAETLKHFMPLNYRNMVLIYIHRRFFAEAISSSPTDPMKSPYALSFLVGFRSACEILNNLRRSFDLFPAQFARVWVVWTHAFSSSDMLASVVMHASSAGTRSKTTGAAMAELRRAVDLFREASTHGGRAAKFLPMLERLLQKAERAYVTAKLSVVRHRDFFSPSFSGPKVEDELSMFGGRIDTVMTRANASYPGSFGGSARPPQPSAAPAVPIQGFPQLHPTLRDQWINFDGHINTHLTNAQRDKYDTKADADASAYSSSLAVQGYAVGEAPDARPHEPAYLHPQQTFYPMVLPVLSSSSLQSALSYGQSKGECESKPQGSTGGSESESGSSGPRASVEHRYPSGEAGYAQQQQTAYEAQAPPLEHAYRAEFPVYAYPQGGMGLRQQQDQPPSYAHDQYGHGLIGQAVSRHAYGGYSGYDYGYGYGYGYVEEPQQQQQLQETWQSFGLHVGSPRPDHWDH